VDRRKVPLEDGGEGARHAQRRCDHLRVGLPFVVRSRVIDAASFGLRLSS